MAEVDMQKEFEQTINSLGWDEVKERFDRIGAELNDLSSVNTDKSAEHVKLEVLARQKAREIISQAIGNVEAEAEGIKKQSIDYS